GAARLAAGAMQLLLLALGIITAAALVGIPAIDLSEARAGLGPVAPWIAVGVFGVGIVLGQCARAGSLGWILLVLYVAYGAQVIGDALFGGVLSAFVGAAVMTPVAVLVARQPSGPPTLVSFMPAFWLLVPGALGLVGVTTILDGDTYGLRTLTTTTTTMVAIALGVLVGLAFSTAGRTVRTRRASSAG
ncbi:MAG: threonine/serine exporter family protein, partial [Terracoccus sp.]